jgi:anti-sigma regulatory factor (Ser/Thr protein kinase)
MSHPATFKHSLAPRLEELHSFRAGLRDWLDEVAVPRAEAEDIVLAAWEVCTNAIEHPTPAPRHAVAVEATALPRGIRVAVRNGGTWSSTWLSRRARGCFGLRMVEGLVDRLAIRRGLGETEVVLFRCTRHA